MLAAFALVVGLTPIVLPSCVCRTPAERIDDRQDRREDRRENRQERREDRWD